MKPKKHNNHKKIQENIQQIILEEVWLNVYKALWIKTNLMN